MTIANHLMPLPIFANWRTSFLLLAGAVGLLSFSNGANNVALAAWLSPVLMLRFLRGQHLKVGLPAAYVVLVAATAFEFRGMLQAPGAAYYVLLALTGIPQILPYLLDRLLAPRLGGLVATLVFPTASVVTEWLGSHGPYGTFGSIAYSQYGDLPLLQILSVTGLWGVTFLIGWFAATCNLVWEEGVGSAHARRAAWLCAATIAAVILVGGASLALVAPSSKLVRVAGISKGPIAPAVTEAVSDRMWAGKATAADFDSIRRSDAAIDDDLLARAEREMQAGAKIIFWAEANAAVLNEDEPAFLARGQALAAKHHAYLGMALAVWHSGPHFAFENKIVLIQPNGQVAWQFSKARPVPGPETAMQIRGNGKLQVLPSPFGRLSSVVCFDGDFPDLLAQAGALRTDILLVPSNDWRQLDPWHTQMASFRAIEQGLNLVRQTSLGLSAAFDYQGRQLGTMDHFHASDYAMVSEIPTQGRRTIYAAFGDWLAFVCMGGLILLLLAGFRKRPEAKVASEQAPVPEG